jgi:NADPH:quinone reductase-like Zn-dependent oxidoreductase
MDPQVVVQFAEVATPMPVDNEVMIKLRAASVNPLDLFLMKGTPWNRVPSLRVALAVNSAPVPESRTLLRPDP